MTLWCILVEILENSSNDDYKSDKFSDIDIYDSSYSDWGDAKHRYMKLREGTKNYKEYRKEVDKNMLLPRRMGFQSNKEKHGNMFLKSFYIGDRYADPFSKGIKNHQAIKKISLSRCGLKDEGFITIMKNAPHNLKELDISDNNQLGIAWYQSIADHLENRENT